MTEPSPAEANFLADVPFFRHLKDEDRLLITGSLEHRHVPEGTIIFATGDPGDSMYVVHSGEVEIYVRNTIGDKIMLATVGEGGLFGELSLLDNGPRSATAQTAKSTDLLVLHRKDLVAFMAHRPEAIQGLLLVVGQRLRDADEMLRGHIIKNLNEVVEQELSPLQRLAHKISNLSGSIPFLIFHLVLFILWVAANLGFGVEPFDPFPYQALCMIVSLEALILSIVVLITQNLEGAREKLRSTVEYETNLKAELEIAHLHSKVDSLHAEVLSRLHRMEDKLN